jgi:hypothetical protein
VKLKKVIVAVAAAVVLAALWHTFGPRTTPASQAPLASLSVAALQDFQSEFNQNADRTRVILLLSPT